MGIRSQSKIVADGKVSTMTTILGHVIKLDLGDQYLQGKMITPKLDLCDNASPGSTLTAQSASYVFTIKFLRFGMSVAVGCIAS